MLLAGKKVLLGVCGGIAAYKSCELARMMVREGAEVQVVMTPQACEFVSALTFSALTGKPALVDEFPAGPTDPGTAIYAHLDTTRGIDCMVVCPATANSMAKLAHGLADNLVCAAFLSCTAPVVIAPAMNNRMWANRSVQANLEILVERGCTIVDPVEGHLACGDEGDGKLANLTDVFSAVATAALSGKEPGFQTGGKCDGYLHSHLAGKKIIVTAGGTREYLDPVRFVTNASTGTLALAVVNQLEQCGAEVVLVDSGITLAPGAIGSNTERTIARTAFDMLGILSKGLPAADGLVMLAAVADYSPSEYLAEKRKKDGKPWRVEFAETVDILANVAKLRKPGQALVGVSLEDTDWLERGMKKTSTKGVDAVLAVELGADLPFGNSKINCALVNSETELSGAGFRDKPEAAKLIVDWLDGYFS